MTSATAEAVGTIKKNKKVSHAKADNMEIPMPQDIGPEYGTMPPESILILDQVRKEFDETGIEELAADIAERGILQPLTVRKTDAGFVLVAGERRLRAAKLAKLASVPVLIREMTIEQHQYAQIAENIQRADLSLAEEADAIRQLHDLFGTVTEVAAKVHKSIGWVSKRLSLAKGLGSYAYGLMADGITEDIELLQCVDKLDKATPGTNSAWALCEKIRAGKAGREDAREALRKATEPKKTGEEPGKPSEPPPSDTLQQSKYFRDWLKQPNAFSTSYMECLIKLVDVEIGPGSIQIIDGLKNQIRQHEEQIQEARKAIDTTMSNYAAAIRDRMEDIALHEAWISYAQQKDPFK